MSQMSSSSSDGSSSSSLSSPSSSSGVGYSEGGEFEVARVLATLGNWNHTVTQSDHGGGDDNCELVDNNTTKYWGSKGKRSSKRVRTESELDLTHSSGSGSGSGLGNSVPLPFDLNVDQAALYDQEDCQENGCQGVDVKTEEVCESAEPSPVSNGTHNGGRLRQNLTEEEKEARRLRRILANRESARQTIRRRQALYEELTRKAADLAAENEKLKRSKELAVKEFQSMQNSNRHLKEQICQAVGFKLGENGREAGNSSSADTANLSSVNWPFLIYNTSSSPFVLPSFIQPSTNVNASQMNSVSLPKVIVPTHQINPCLSQKQETALNINNQNMPWCIFPCPWLLPMQNVQANGIDNIPSSHLNHKDEEGFLDAKHICSPSSIIPAFFSQSSVKGDVKTEPQIATQAKPRNGFLEAPFDFSQNSREKEGCMSPHVEVPSATGVQSVLPEHRKEGVFNFSKKKKDATAGAEARKRRREVMKLKSIHYVPARGGYG